MGFGSLDALISAMTVSGKTNDFWYQKLSSNGATGAAGRWYELLSGAGTPSAMTLTGSAGVAFALNSSTAGSIPLIEGNVSSDTRHLLNLQMFSPTATMNPATLVLCDFLLCYPSIVVTGTPTTLDNTVTLPRYTDGIGVRALVCAATAFGAASPALTMTFTSVNSAGSTTGSRTAVMTASANSAPISNILLNSAQPFFPIPSGDVGVKSVQSYTLSSGTTGTASILLCKPIIQIPLSQQYLPTERDLVFALDSMPRIYDGACLGFLVMPGAAMVSSALLQGRIQYAWGS